MASEARTGWGGEFHMSSDLTTGNLLELVEVTGFGLPDDETDEVEVTHLKSPDKRKEFIAGMKDGGEVTVSFNYVPGSATDVRIRTNKDSGDVVAVRMIVPDEDGEPDWQIDTFGFVKGYARGPLAAGDKIDASVRVRITGAQAEAAAA